MVVRATCDLVVPDHLIQLHRNADVAPQVPEVGTVEEGVEMVGLNPLNTNCAVKEASEMSSTNVTVESTTAKSVKSQIHPGPEDSKSAKKSGATFWNMYSVSPWGKSVSSTVICANAGSAKTPKQAAHAHP